MQYTGLSIIIRNKKEFDRVKDFLADDLYMGFVDIMSTIETAIVIYADIETNFSTGCVGCSKHQKEAGLRMVEFSEFFK